MSETSKASRIRKLWRFTRIYGFRRAVFKAAGRLRAPFRLVWRKAPRPDIAIVGCGQFAFSTIGFFLSRQFGNRILGCFDQSTDASASFARTFSVPSVTTDPGSLISNPEVRIVYIASNHASHTDYAVRALEENKIVYVEKPVSVSGAQLSRLAAAVRSSGGRLHAGYNRPFSGALRELRRSLGEPKGPLSLGCFVSGHQIGPDHWYRRPEEGTRICGNAGHWIDLFVHLLAWREIPDQFWLQILSANSAEPDDNFVLSIRTGAGDLFSLMLTSRTEPFEGINETLNLQWDDTIAKIDDFRLLTIWQGEELRRRRFSPKDVGHRAAILEPFSPAPYRSWSEVELSTMIMLRITDMVRSGEFKTALNLPSELLRIARSENSV